MDGVIVINEADNVVVAIKDIKKGDKVSYRLKDQLHEIIAKEDIPYGLKMAIQNICSYEAILKYGEAIGESNKSISIGELVHIHNMEGRRGRGDK